HMEHAPQHRDIAAKPVDQMFPIDGWAVGINQIENIGPIAMVALHDVELAPEEFLHGHHLQPLATNHDRHAALEPFVIHLRALIGHRPDNVDNDPETHAAVDPFAI